MGGEPASASATRSLSNGAGKSSGLALPNGGLGLDAAATVVRRRSYERL
jgi:hypothetical protein